MNSIVVTYPKFHALPKGLKRMLVLSETLFFTEARQLTQVHYDEPRFKVQLNGGDFRSRTTALMNPWLLEELGLWSTRKAARLTAQRR